MSEGRVRFALDTDMPALVELGRAMVAEAVSLSHRTFDPAILMLNLADVHERGVILVHEGGHGLDGALLGVTEPGLAWRETTAYELGFYVKPEARRSGVAQELIRNFIAWAEMREAHDVAFGDGLGVAHEATTRLALSLGFELQGFSYRLRLRP